MARTKTLLQMRTECRQRADVEAVYIGSSELDAMINSSIAELYDLLVSVNQDYYLSSDDISVVAGTATYALAADFWRALGCDYQEGTRWIQMPRFNWAERNQYQDGGGTQSQAAYRVMGSNLRIRPEPSWSGTVRLWYIPAPEVLSEDDDTFDGIAGWEEYVVTDVVIKLKSKQEENAELEVAQKKVLYSRIKNSASERDSGEPDQVRDVHAEMIGTDIGEGWY